MATRFWGINRGETEGNVVNQGTTPGKSVEVKVDTASGITKGEVLVKLKELENAILKDEAKFFVS